MNTSNFKQNPVSILDLSKRTVTKILRRANLPCSICAWNEAQCDIHHILEKANNGDDKMENLICLCPNCHRKIHEHGDKFKSKDELKLLSLEKIFPQWKDYYNPLSPRHYSVIRERNKNVRKTCSTCGKEIPIDNNFCSIKCAGLKHQKFSFGKLDVEKWKQENLPLTKIARLFGVSDNAIKKRLKKIGLLEFYRDKV